MRVSKLSAPELFNKLRDGAHLLAGEGGSYTLNGRVIPPAVLKTLNQFALKKEDVVQVYSGKAGRCACGCQGKYTVAAQHLALASKRRGYSVLLKEVNDREVTRITNILRSSSTTQFEIGMDGEVIASTTIGGRIYVAYLK